MSGSAGSRATSAAEQIGESSRAKADAAIAEEPAAAKSILGQKHHRTSFICDAMLFGSLEKQVLQSQSPSAGRRTGSARAPSTATVARCQAPGCSIKVIDLPAKTM